MKTGSIRKVSTSMEFYKQMSKPDDASHEEFKMVIRELNKLRAHEIVENDGGLLLKSNLGRIIILKTTTRVKKLYSPITKKRIYNLHTFQHVYKVFHVEKRSLKWPTLFKFRANRPNVKVPLYNHLNAGTKDYYKHSEYSP